MVRFVIKLKKIKEEIIIDCEVNKKNFIEADHRPSELRKYRFK